MTSEFELIARHFRRATLHTDLGVGDDGALCSVRPGHQLVVSTDMLVSGTHFLPDAEPQSLGWKTAAVNVSDMAAMAAAPRWITLALALPAADETWVAQFADGFAACCEEFGLDWIGGDTTRGPLNLCATVFGEVPSGAAVRRDGAQPGDDIWVSGRPGLATLGLQHLLGQSELAPAWQATCLQALHRPQPRVALGLALRGVASAMLDISDGLAGDLGHILEQSRCGAELEDEALPLQALLAACGSTEAARTALLHGGDDYELLFCAPTTARSHIASLDTELALTRIGSITAAPGLHLCRADGTRVALPARGYMHF